MEAIKSKIEKNTADNNSWLSKLSFHFPLRKYQKEIIDLCNKKLDNGEEELHIVAPPGAGKTIIGLEIISQFKCPSLVLCPNTTIQSQWSKKLDHFISPNDLEFARHELLGSHKDRPLKPITVMTYQALSVPGKEKEYLHKLATTEWINELSEVHSTSRADAEIRLLDLQKNNPKAYKKDLSRHTSRLRRNLVDVLDLDEVLHENSLELMQNLKRANIGLVIFDECHHLTDFWASVMIHLVRRLDDVIVVGLTGTPPESKSGKQKNRYLNLVGEIDYQVPTPALVKEGGLAPYQDLVYFTEPLDNEFEFLNNCHQEIHKLLEDLNSKSTVGNNFSSYIQAEFSKKWSSLIDEKPDLAMAMSRYIYSNKLTFPSGVILSDSMRQAPLLMDWMNLLEDYALNNLKVSDKESSKELYKRISRAVKQIGFSLSERGIRKVASKVDRVLAYSQSKSDAISKILSTEYSYLEENLRAVVVCDFEKMSATSAKPLKGILDAEAGGAIGTLKALLEKEISDNLNPCLVTGSRLLVDNRILDTFLAAAREYLESNKIEIELTANKLKHIEASEIKGNSSNWTSRVYVAMTTKIFERGLTKCLIGTRGILGEGWDCQQLNTIIDLTTSTSAVSVKQLRGRGIRLNTKDAHSQRKVANNWDIVCIAPSLEKGLNDYYRFVKKHNGYFGIADDGQIECGVGHVHPSFSDMTPVEVFANLTDFNFDMLNRAVQKDHIYDLWKVGKPYANKQIGCVELARTEISIGRNLYLKDNLDYPKHVEEVRNSIRVTWKEYTFMGLALSGCSYLLFSVLSFPIFLSLVPMIVLLILGEKEKDSILEKLESDLNEPATVNSVYKNMGAALLEALKERKFLPKEIESSSITINQRKDNTFRIFLDDAQAEHSNLFIGCFHELLAPVSNQSYLLPRYEFELDSIDEETFIDDYISGKFESKIASYHAIPKLLARSEAGRQSLEYYWNQYVSPGYIIETDKNPDLLLEYLGTGPRLSTRELWA